MADLNLEKARVDVRGPKLVAEFLHCLPVGALSAVSDSNGGVIATVPQTVGHDRRLKADSQAVDPTGGEAAKGPGSWMDSEFWHSVVIRLRSTFPGFTWEKAEEGVFHFNLLPN